MHATLFDEGEYVGLTDPSPDPDKPLGQYRD
jgi:hypothetical protein